MMNKNNIIIECTLLGIKIFDIIENADWGISARIRSFRIYHNNPNKGEFILKLREIHGGSIYRGFDFIDFRHDE